MANHLVDLLVLNLLFLVAVSPALIVLFVWGETFTGFAISMFLLVSVPALVIVIGNSLVDQPQR